jgi:hypothetical protein
MDADRTGYPRMPVILCVQNNTWYHLLAVELWPQTPSTRFYHNGIALGSAIVTNDLEKSKSWCYPYIVKESICITKIRASVIWSLKSVAFANG